MNLPRAAVARPVFTTMVTLIVVILGSVALTRLRQDLLPNIELPTVTVRTQYEGASPEVMERLVTQILEEIIATVPGVVEMTSQSSEGNSSIRVAFGWGTDIDTAAIDVQATIEDEINELPDDIVRPRVSKFDIASFPVVILGISSKLDPVELTEFIDDQIRYRFQRIDGVAQVDTWGGYNREIRVELDPDRLRAFQIPIDTILDRIRAGNLDLPAGKIEAGRYEVTLRAPSEYKSVEQIRQTVVLSRGDSVVTLGQVAAVHDTYEKLTRIVRVNGERGIRVAIRKQAEANTVEVSSRVLAEIDAVNAEFPQVRVTPVVNQGNFIETSIRNVSRSVLYGGALALIVLLVFLRDLRSTFLIALAIPISGIFTFALIFFCGFTLNLMTLGGLALGIGMMVDGSVVVLENIFRRRAEDGESRRDASVNGGSEVATAIFASTITTLVIFLPLIFVRGVTGILFQELAYVIMFSLFAALLVSLTVVPMLASKVLRKSNEKRTLPFPIGALAGAADAFFRGLEESYKALLEWVLRHRLITVVFAFGVFGASLLLVPRLGTEFLPPSDEGEVRVRGNMELGTRLDLVDRQTKLMEEVVKDAVPEAVSSVVTVGASGRRARDAARGQIQLALKPASQRTRSNVDVANDLRKKLAGKIPGMEVRARARQGQFLLERVLGGDEGLRVEVRGHDLARLDALAARVFDAMEGIPGITDRELTRDAGKPQAEIRVDRRRVADLGLTVRDVAEVIETAVAGSRAGNYRVDGNSYRILVQLADAERRSLDEILDLTISRPDGDPVVLRNVVETTAGAGPVVIERKDQQRVMYVEANVVDRDMGSVAADMQARLDEIPRPAGFEIDVGGNFEEQERALDELVVSLILALVLVYMVMACQYESFRDPCVVMFSVPLAAIGVIVTLFLTQTTLNVQSAIGCIMLGGIVVNNAILLVDQAGQLARAGMTTRDAVAEAGRRRLRPILMTSLTTMLALVPLALGLGEGADAQAPLARAVVGGLAASTLITLVLIPAVYSLFHPERRSEAA